MVVTNPSPVAQQSNVIAGRYRMIGNYIAMHMEGPYYPWIVSQLTFDPVDNTVTLAYLGSHPTLSSAITSMTILNQSEG